MTNLMSYLLLASHCFGVISVGHPPLNFLTLRIVLLLQADLREKFNNMSTQKLRDPQSIHGEILQKFEKTFGEKTFEKCSR